MIEDKKPEYTRKYKIRVFFFDLKIVVLIMYLVGVIQDVIWNTGMGLWDEWYIIALVMMIGMFTPLRKPDKEYVK